ncbi:hypothetical protein FJV41_44275 [Myxococcus llanfairpwllgwyngyllgogerychwyrndrobwllllantysiliogogogochensis]|uniref:Uncharacterized protein n=1 Tax=Myxococcus llanfairpwllgwyngyllgogerychwyrndrobwllllantysiliogogogochensis TaxID=2590453 RepID=A0A540WM58_9BACT|nr:hypothetical protein [Myxococcus llanfairpwllgwyngyllgogerychwyrndrobwllllantysiliogogogochensis]TQF09504.1 hypothetical protein FJV41_44275 [Myxococcus llanfairpwllgwyngyllgogerychwyrndrobwllllantysiliogogogochensis]
MTMTTTQARWRRVAVSGWMALALCGGVAVARAVTSEVRTPSRRLSAEERVLVGRAAAEAEPHWRRRSMHSFPGDHWSQDDDFGASERGWVMNEARRRDVPVTDVFDAIDTELRSAAPILPPRKASASPCKPRPFYD